MADSIMTEERANRPASCGFLAKLVVGTLLILINALGLAGFSLYRSWQQYQDRIEIQTQNLAQSLSLSLAGILDKSCVAVFSIKKELELQALSGRLDRKTVQEYIAQHKARLPEVDGLRVADARGDIIYGDGVLPGSRVNIADRDYFIKLRSAPGSGMVLTKPLYAIISRQWVVEVVTRLDNPDGSFAGVAYAAISLDYLSRLFASLNVGPHGVINLRDRDLDVVVRYPDFPGKGAVRSKLVSDELKGLVQSGHSKGTYRSQGSVDRVERVISFQELRDYPLYITVGISTDDFYRPWRLEAKDILLLSSMLVVILLVSAWLLCRNQKRKLAAELTLSRYQEELEQTVHQRTAELELKNRQLAEEITLRRQAEVELQKAAIIMQKMSDVVVWIAPDGRILYANDAATKLHGYSREEFCSLSISTLAPRFTPESWQQHWEDLRREQTLHVEAMNRAKSGREFPVEVTANYLCIDGVEYNCAICRDLSERREAESEKQDLMQQLFQAQKIESIGRLAGGIAHDFNNLLTPILGYAELLKLELCAESSQYRKVDLISQAGEKAKILIRQLLGFGRQQLLEMKTVEVNAVVQQFYEILRRTIRENIEIKLTLCSGTFGVRADVNQLEQIIMNLAINAQDAIEDKGSISIETAPVTLNLEYARQHADVTPGEYLMLAVSDSGCGMSEETLSHIFEPFFTTKGIGKGTGLGLATIYGLVKQHSGHLWVGSEAGKGTTFKVYLPVVEGVPLPEAPAPPSLPRQQARDCRLLLVEDSRGVRDMVSDLLACSGYDALVAETPVQALRLAHQHHIDLLVSDVVMPDMSGPELYQELQKIQPGMKVLYMSGYTFNVIAHGGQLVEGLHFLQKPFGVTDLTGKIDAILAC
jgi:two-component system, cell cycle sensor histidine kinase and response regulator CckA